MRGCIASVLTTPLLLLAFAGVGWAGESPVAVSPGDASKLTLIEGRCPTFSWGLVEGARSYELVVYRLGEEAEEAQVVLRQSFAGSASGWTPSYDRCLERGGQYAWSVRALGQKEAPDWSPPSLFQVASGYSEAEFEEALAVVRSYLVRHGEPGAGGSESPRGIQDAESEILSSAITPEPSAATFGSVGVGQLTVEGEVRTINPKGDPRLWGQGRPETVRHGFLFSIGGITLPFLCSRQPVKFGLSSMAVDWGSAAAACPAGTWVCSRKDIGTTACSTDRPSSGGVDCDGEILSLDPGDTEGWVLEDTQPGGATGLGKARLESGGYVSRRACQTLPTWCCSE